MDMQKMVTAGIMATTEVRQSLKYYVNNFHLKIGQKPTHTTEHFTHLNRPQRTTLIAWQKRLIWQYLIGKLALKGRRVEIIILL